MQNKKALLIIYLIILTSAINLIPDNKEMQFLQEHYKFPWKVHNIAGDFQLLDIWEFPIRADPDKKQDFFFFLNVLREKNSFPGQSLRSPLVILAGILFILREISDKLFHLDSNLNILPIPGSREKSIKERLPRKELEHDLTGKIKIWTTDNGKSGFRPVYLFREEALWEISINPAHALMHFGWIKKKNNLYTARLAIYAKNRGMLGTLYMKIIMPFRRNIIYPTMLEVIKTKWQNAVKINKTAEFNEGNLLDTEK